MAVAAQIETLKAMLEKLVLDPKLHDVLSVAKAARNGAVYGSKNDIPLSQRNVGIKVSFFSLRLSSLTSVPLFMALSFREKAKLVFQATKTHARNLATFASIYQACMVFLRRFGPTPGKEGPYDAFLAGLVGGYVVFGRRSPRTGRISSVSQQIVIYVCARVVLALAKMSVKPGIGLPLLSTVPERAHAIEYYAWPAFASMSWAMVMYLFRWHPDELQGSLRSSMVYIYRQANNWDSLRNFLWHNA
ncbi:peroxisomal membrane protein 24 [Ceratocystis lukuohia]|uniref:Peroxisomal membrane protein 24 n=1 Tax=Ceratocystis lukuohia TaxID=2019550 RepID=A0ABR4MK68_9PEZI